MIRDQIVDKCLSHRLRCSLLRENDLTLASALNIARSMEDADRQAEQMEEHVPEGHAVCATTTSRPARRTPTWTAAAASDRPDGREKCSRCGKVATTRTAVLQRQIDVTAAGGWAIFKGRVGTADLGQGSMFGS